MSYSVNHALRHLLPGMRARIACPGGRDELIARAERDFDPNNPWTVTGSSGITRQVDLEYVKNHYLQTCPSTMEYRRYVGLMEGAFAYPIPLEDVVMHLNDIHLWTRHQIADWLDTLDVDLTFPTEPPPPPVDRDTYTTLYSGAGTIIFDSLSAEMTPPIAIASSGGYVVATTAEYNVDEAFVGWMNAPDQSLKVQWQNLKVLWQDLKVNATEVGAKYSLVTEGAKTADTALTGFAKALQQKHEPPAHVALLEKQKKRRRRKDAKHRY